MRSAMVLTASPNKILASLPAAELEALRPHLTRVRLVAGQVLIDRGMIAEHAFFIEEGVTSLNAETQRGEPGVQIAMIGNEGLVGGISLLDPATASFGIATVHIPGPALRMRVADLSRCLDDSALLRDRCMTYVQSLTRQIMSTAASNARASLAERCIRWLLMAHERIEGDDIPVTHGALSIMLGVRRSGVTVATTALQKAGLIHTGRGRIRVLDRAGLEALADGGGPDRGGPDGAVEDGKPEAAEPDSVRSITEPATSDGARPTGWPSMKEEIFRL